MLTHMAKQIVLSYIDGEFATYLRRALKEKRVGSLFARLVTINRFLKSIKKAASRSILFSVANQTAV